MNRLNLRIKFVISPTQQPFDIEFKEKIRHDFTHCVKKFCYASNIRGRVDCYINKSVLSVTNVDWLPSLEPLFEASL